MLNIGMRSYCLFLEAWLHIDLGMRTNKSLKFIENIYSILNLRGWKTGIYSHRNMTSLTKVFGLNLL